MLRQNELMLEIRPSVVTSMEARVNVKSEYAGTQLSDNDAYFVALYCFDFRRFDSRQTVSTSVWMVSMLVTAMSGRNDVKTSLSGLYKPVLRSTWSTYPGFMERNIHSARIVRTSLCRSVYRFSAIGAEQFDNTCLFV